MNDLQDWWLGKPAITYRLYPDGTVVHEDDFETLDNAQPYYDDYQTIVIPEEIVKHLEATWY